MARRTNYLQALVDSDLREHDKAVLVLVGRSILGLVDQPAWQHPTVLAR
jgi:hypothetical protein